MARRRSRTVEEKVEVEILPEKAPEVRPPSPRLRRGLRDVPSDDWSRNEDAGPGGAGVVVEAAGIEPASAHTPEGPGYMLSRSSDLARSSSDRQDRVLASPP